MGEMENISDRLDSEIGELDLRIQSRLIRQEHRLWSLVKNLFKYWSYDHSDPRRSAAIKALLCHFISFRGATQAGISALAVAGVLLACQANRLLEDQNRRLEESLHLMESERRGALVFELSAIYDKVDEELGEQVGKVQYDTLSDHLAARIVSASRSFVPYRYYDASGHLTIRSLSPERGQLLTVLHHSRLLTIDLLQKCDFRSMQLQGADLNKLRPSYTNMIKAFQLDGMPRKDNADFWSYVEEELKSFRVDFSGSDFAGADLRRANLSYFDLRRCNFLGADLSNAKLDSAMFAGSLLLGAKIKRSYKPLLKEQGYSAQQLEQVIFVD